jgi:hypothetical protein
MVMMPNFFNPQTQLGQAFANLGTAFMNKPTDEQLQAQADQMQVGRNNAKLSDYKVQGMEGLGGILATLGKMKTPQGPGTGAPGAVAPANPTPEADYGLAARYALQLGLDPEKLGGYEQNVFANSYGARAPQTTNATVSAGKDYKGTAEGFDLTQANELQKAKDEQAAAMARTVYTQGQENSRHSQDLAAQDGQALDPATIHYWAQSVAAGGGMPTMGMGKQAAAMRQAILTEAAKINTGQGMSGQDQNANVAGVKADTNAVRMVTQQAALGSKAYETLEQNIGMARDIMGKGVGKNGVPVIDRYGQYIRGQYQGDPDVAALDQALGAIAVENAKLRSGSFLNQAPTDAEIKSIRDHLNIAATKGQLESQFEVFRREGANSVAAYEHQRQSTTERLRGHDKPSGQAPKATSSTGVIPPAAVEYLKQHPEMSAQFDQKYGAGASASVIGQ